MMSLIENRILRWDLVPEPVLATVFERPVDSGRPFGLFNRGIRHGEDGLWIVWNDRDPDAPTMTEIAIDFPVRLLADGIIELIDPETGVTLASRRVDGGLNGFAGGSPYVVAPHMTDQGVPYIHLLWPRLVRDARN